MVPSYQHGGKGLYQVFCLMAAARCQPIDFPLGRKCLDYPGLYPKGIRSKLKGGSRTNASFALLTGSVMAKAGSSPETPRHTLPF